ncbi:MAG TPA: ferric reductase-like transmembrane domain-containing protein [Chloroflexaceae bacterium]|nr:ferric reductase-like transmembrane domain-containing protein [Chloroflexaceae bacterium]
MGEPGSPTTPRGATRATAGQRGAPALLRAARAVVHIGALLPLALMGFDALAGRLSVNPIQELTQRTGMAALVLLLLCLACTPANRLLGWRWAASLRKPLGLYSFLYVCLHLLIFVAVDYGLDPGLIGQAIAEKRYVLAGLAAFLLLLPLALTSTKGAQRRLGRWWRRLHRLIYPAAALAVLHFLWLSKTWREPLVYGLILLALLAARFLRSRRAPARMTGRAARTPPPRS